MLDSTYPSEPTFWEREYHAALSALQNLEDVTDIGLFRVRRNISDAVRYWENGGRCPICIDSLLSGNGLEQGCPDIPYHEEVSAEDYIEEVNEHTSGDIEAFDQMMGHPMEAVSKLMTDWDTFTKGTAR